MAAPKTVLTYPLNGTTVTFQVPFEYLARRFVQVTLIGATRRILILNTDYRFTTTSSITTTRAWGPADGYESIEIRRFTSATDRIITFSDGSILRANDLNFADIQALHVAEEARDLTSDTIAINNDGDLDARGKKIVNVADATEPGGVITLRQVTAWNDSALNSKNAAAASAAAAAVSATNAANSASSAATSASSASTSATNANTSRTQAAASATSASTSATTATNAATSASASASSASTSASTATTQANRAETQADRAQTIADGLGNLNPLGDAVQSIDSGTKVVTWKASIKSNGTSIRFSPNLTSSEFGNTNSEAYMASTAISGDVTSLSVNDNGNAYIRLNNTTTQIVLTNTNHNTYVASTITAAINSQVPPMITSRLNTGPTTWTQIGTYGGAGTGSITVAGQDLRGRTVWVLRGTNYVMVKLPPVINTNITVSVDTIQQCIFRLNGANNVLQLVSTTTGGMGVVQLESYV